jgi:hypothetical protein
MTALVLLRLRASLRHLVRGRPGSAGWVARVGVLAILVLLGEVLIFWFSSQPPSDAGVTAQLYGPVGVVLGVTAGGAIVLLVEASRENLGGVANGSQALPLSRAQLVIVDSAPAVLLALGLTLVTIPPVAGLLRAAGTVLTSAFALASCAVTLGVAVTAVVVVAAALLMPGPRWASVRLPVAMLAAGALLVAGITQTVVEFTEGRRGVVAEVLVLPGLIRHSFEGTAANPALVAVTALAALVATGVLLPVAAGRGWGSHSPAVRVTWHGRGAGGQVQADLLQVLRSPMMIANGVSVLLVVGASVVGVLTLEARIAEALLPLLVVVGCALAGSVVRLHRGLLPAVRTPQQLIGFTVGAFTASQLAVGMALMAALLSPLLLLAIRPPHDVVDITIDTVVSALVAYALATLSSWLVPIEARKGATQALAAFVTSVVTVAALAALVQLPAATHLATLLIASGGTVLALLAAWRLEAARWRPHPRHPHPEPHHPHPDERGRP